MKTQIINFSIVLLLISCSSNSNNKPESNKQVKQITTTKCSINYTPTLIDTLKVDSLMNQSSSLKDSSSLPPPQNTPPDYKKIKFPVLMLIANGCQGVTTYTYVTERHRNEWSEWNTLKINKEYPNCPDPPGYKSPRGTFFSKIPTSFSVCKTNYIIRLMKKEVPDYLKLYNNYFKDSLKIRTPPPYTVTFPYIIYEDEGNGGNTTITYDSKRNRLVRGGTVHSHDFSFDPNDCRHGIYLSKLPDTLADSTVQFIIDETTKFKRYKNYKTLYIEKYGGFPFTKDLTR